MMAAGRVRYATRRDITALAGVLARAFQDDPITNWILPDENLRRRRLPCVYGMKLHTWFIDHAETYVYCRDGAILAGALMSVTATLTQAQPAQTHWYLAELATDPDVQRTGLGDQLMRTHLRRCDAEGSPVYLETAEHNISYYMRYGFACGNWRAAG